MLNFKAGRKLGEKVNYAPFLSEIPADTSEAALAKIAIEWLQTDNWEVYEEVSPWGGSGSRADIVARKGKIVWVIETKQNFSLNLLEQSERWRHYAHFVSMCVWYNGRINDIVSKICRSFGTGLITIRKEKQFAEYRVTEHVEGAFNRRADTKPIKEMLIAENQDTVSAGTKSHRYNTPFKITAKKIVQIVRENPGISIEEAVRFRHHYADNKKAKINIISAIEKKIISDLRCEKRAGKYFLYPAGNAEKECNATEDSANRCSNHEEIMRQHAFPLLQDLFN